MMKMILSKWLFPNILYGTVACLCVYGLNRNFDMPVENATNEEVQSSKMEIDSIDAVASLHLFGISQGTLLKKVDLNNIKLLGIIYNDKESKAIMAIEGKEEELIKGCKIANEYTIQAIEQNSVIVKGPNGLEVFEMFSS